VHLQYLPEARLNLIDEALSQKIGLMKEVVRLSASIRARANVKLRQPLPKLQFAISTNTVISLSDEDLAIIAGEANVKTVEILESVEGLATAVIKVDARKVGKKYGKKVQDLIKAGKEGNFKMKACGQIEIEGEILEIDEYETAFLTEEGSEADCTPNAVVILDTELTPELMREGEAREIIRAVQDLRKSSGFEVSDRIEITFETSSDNLNQTIQNFGEQIQGEVLANSLSAGNGEHEVNIDDQIIKISLTKA
jgi:isoleucyl-tRNA synthetase